MAKVLVFTMSDPHSAKQADSIIRAFRSVGWQSIICYYSASNGIYSRELNSRDGTAILTLSDAGFDSIPMLSTSLYRKLYGDDIDIDAILGFSLWQDCNNISQNTLQSLPSAKFLHPDSAFQQKLLGFAARVEEFLNAVAPNLVIIPHSGEALSRIMLSKTLKLGLPWLISESSFFPEHILLDPCGQHFMRGHNQIDADAEKWISRPLSKAQQKSVNDFIFEWKAKCDSKYPQGNTVSKELAHFLATPGPILFIPQQMPGDANVYFGLDTFNSLADYYHSLIHALPTGWRAIIKPHPIDNSSNPWRPPEDPRFFVAPNANIHDLIKRADAVAVFSSNVGLEALIYEKPVLVGGKPCYGGKGVTLEVNDRKQISKIISAAPKFRPDSDLRDRLLHYLLNDYLIAENDTDRLHRKLARLDDSKRNQINQRAPFYEADPDHVRAFRTLLIRYRSLAEQDYDHEEILRCLDRSATKAEYLPLTDKDWPCPWLHREDPGLVSAYLFSAGLVESPTHILDYGCGHGCGAWLLAQTKHQVRACATSRSLLDYAKRTWLHRRISYQFTPPNALINGILPSSNWPLALLIDSLSGVYRPLELLAAIAKTLTEDGALLVRLADPRRAAAPHRHSPLQSLTPEEINAWCEHSEELKPVHIFYQQESTLRSALSPKYDHIWMLLSRRADSKNLWRERLLLALQRPLPTLLDELSPTGLGSTILRRRKRWLQK